MGPDGWINLYFQNHPPAFPLRELGLFLNELGKGDVLAFVCILLVISGYFLGRARLFKAGFGGIAAILLATPILHFFKQIIGRARPQLNLGEWYFMGPNFFKGGFDAFPSGHATASFALAAFLSRYYPKFKYVFYGTAAAIAVVGRVMQRHHFLTDVLAGAVLGTVCGLWLAGKLSRWIENDGSPAPETSPEDDPRRKSGQPDTMGAALMTAAVAALILVPALGQHALWDRDETEYAQAVIEMQAKNEWLIPTLEGQPFIEKPILMYWVLRVSYLLLGVSEFSSRLPSALFAVLTCVAVFFLGKTLWGNRAGLFSGIVLATSLLFAGGSGLLMTDPFFVFFTTLSLLFYARAWKKPEASTLDLVLCYAAVGLAVLTKGPFGFFPIPVFLIFEAWTRKQSAAEMVKNAARHALFSLVSLAVAGPWFLHSFSVQKQATEGFFLYDNLTRFLQSAEGHSGPMFYYVIVLLAGLFPWSFLMFPYFSREWRGRKVGVMSADVLLLTLWTAFQFLFFSVCATKLPHYMLPALPALACLLGKFWEDIIAADGPAPGAALTANFIFSVLLVLAALSIYFLRPQYASVYLVLPFLLQAGFLLAAGRLAQKRDWLKSFRNAALGSVFLFLAFSRLGLPALEKHHILKPLGLAIKTQVPADADLAGYRFSEPSLFIYGGRLFPKIEDAPLDSLLGRSEPVYIVLKEKDLQDAPPASPYRVLNRFEGIAENHGETALLLITNAP